KAKELESMGAHILAIKDMAGLCKPQAAYNLVDSLKQEIGIPIHFHTHDTSGLNAASVMAAARAGVDIVDLAMASLSGSTSQPNLNSIAAALSHSDLDPRLDIETLNEISDYWEETLNQYTPFNSAPRAGTAEVYEHEMPGGQYTNLREQANAMGLGHRWREIARTYSEVNQLFGDIVKVTPSSKVVGDMAMFLITRGIRAADVPKLKPGSIDWPESVIDMLAGGLGQPDGGWPDDLKKVILHQKPATTRRPGELASSVNLRQSKEHLSDVLKRPTTDDDLYSHLMYPQVFEEFNQVLNTYDDLSSLPTSAFFYGLKPGEEIDVEIDQGKTLFIKLVSIGEADGEGRRTLFFELNGMPRESVIIDRALAGNSGPARQKGNPNQDGHVCAPMPGMVTEVAVSPGQEVAEGEKLVVLEAMKMLTTVSATKAGTIQTILVTKGDQVDSDDLLLEID
ncbi:MAG: biotin/lipoyl-containing protein, partial [Verrucomicrobiales bacterium]